VFIIQFINYINLFYSWENSGEKLGVIVGNLKLEIEAFHEMLWGQGSKLWDGCPDKMHYAVIEINFIG